MTRSTARGGCDGGNMAAAPVEVFRRGKVIGKGGVHRVRGVPEVAPPRLDVLLLFRQVLKRRAKESATALVLDCRKGRYNCPQSVRGRELRRTAPDPFRCCFASVSHQTSVRKVCVFASPMYRTAVQPICPTVLVQKKNSVRGSVGPWPTPCLHLTSTKLRTLKIYNFNSLPTGTSDDQ